MRGREGLVVAGVGGLLSLAWLGFLVHRSPRFAGSPTGVMFGIAGAVLLLLPLAYTVAKRVPGLRTRMTTRVSMQTLLSLHIYTGILGPLLGLVHSGHKFDSVLGVALTTVMLLVVVSGVALRYLLTYLDREITEKLVLLQTARGDLDSAWGALERAPADARSLPRSPVFAASLASLGIERRTDGPAGEVARCAEGVADLEYGVRTHEALKRWFGRSLVVHVALSVLLYVLLALHVWSSAYFAVRWSRWAP